MQTKYKKSYPFLLSSIGFLVIALLLINVGGFVQDMGFLFGIFVTEYFIILVPIFTIGKLGGVNIKSSLKFNALSFDLIWRIVAIAIFFLPIVGFVNFFSVFLLSFGGYVEANSIPNPDSIPLLIWHLVLVALSAGLCEEIFFRGMMLSAFESRMSSKKAIFWVAILFGVFHFNMQNFFGPVILGILFGNLVLVTDSIWASVIAHSANNALAVLIGYYFEKIVPNNSLESELVSKFKPIDYLPTLIALGILSIISIVVVRKIFNAIKILSENSKQINILEDIELTQTNNKKGVIWYEILPILAVCTIYVVYMTGVFSNG